MDIQINNVSSLCSFSYSFDNITPFDDRTWEHCTVKYEPFSSSVCYLNVRDLGSSDETLYLVVPLKTEKCLFVNMKYCCSCFFTPTASLQDISEDLYEIFEDSEHAFLLASIVQSLFLTIEDPGKLPLCIPDNIHLPLKS